jgi:hypothetical protein
MKRTISFLAVGVASLVVGGAAAAPTVKPTRSITISLSRPTVVFGGTVTLSGTVSSQQAGEKVIVLAQPYGGATFLPVATVDSGSGGAWTYTATPMIQTAYEAKWLAASSQSVSVKVRPALTLSTVSVSGSRGTFNVKATADRSFAGKFVLVQRFAGSRAIQVKKVVLASDSSATFTVRLTRGTSRLRAVMPTSQTQPGYIAGQSAVLSVHR